MATWSAVHSTLMRAAGIDQLEDADYNQHIFTRFTHVVGGPSGAPVRMDRNALNQLASELQTELDSPPHGVDIPGITAFLELIRASLPKNT